MTMRWALSAALCGVSLLAACGKKVSDTGYIGTWSRGSVAATSTVSISKTGDQYRFHWNLAQKDGNWTVTCDKNSHCEEISDHKRVAEYQFSTRVDPETGHLIVQGDVTVYGRTVEKRTDIDELIVEGGGLKLGSYTIERNGQKMKLGEGPLRFFDKVSDEVIEPGS